MKSKTTVRSKEGSLILDFNDFFEYDDIETIFNVLSKYFNAELIEKKDGPASRFWTVSIHGSLLTLGFVDGYGYYLKADSSDGFREIEGINSHWHIYQ